jgi:hypothetical protein
MKPIHVVATIGIVVSFLYFVGGKNNQELELAEVRQKEVQIELSEKAARLFRAFLKEDINSFATGTAQSVFGTGSIYAPVPIVTTADQMQNDYERNEVAGDQKYRDKELVVNAKVASIDRGIGENYFISLIGGSNSFMRPKAKMADGNVEFLAALDKNQSVSLVCKGGGMLMGSAMLADCAPLEKWLDTTVEVVFRSWRKLVNAKEKTISGLIVLSHIYGESPELNACLTEGMRKACEDELKKIQKELDPSKAIEVGKKFGIDTAFLAHK